MAQTVQATDEAIFTEAELAEARRYPIVIRWSEEDQLYLVSLPDFNSATSHGRTLAEAAERGIEMVAELIDIKRRSGKSVPEPGTVREFIIL